MFPRSYLVSKLIYFSIEFGFQCKAKLCYYLGFVDGFHIFRIFFPQKKKNSIERAKSNYGGGILALESGVCKGSIVISLALDDKGFETQTLIVCPSVSLFEWQKNYLRLDMPTSVIVCEETSDFEELVNKDFVTTSYESIRKRLLSTLQCQYSISQTAAFLQ